jgi:hypothetical protein
VISVFCRSCSLIWAPPGVGMKTEVLATNAPKGRASYAVPKGNALELRGFSGGGVVFCPVVL